MKQQNKSVAELKPVENAGGFFRQWTELPAVQKYTLLLLILLVFLPLLRIFINRAFINFTMDNTAYALMHFVERVRVGEPLYIETRPGAYSPAYTPLAFWLVGYLCRIFGSSMVVGSLTCVFWMVVSWVVITAFVWRRTHDTFLSLAACLIWVAIYGWMSPTFCFEIVPSNGMLVTLSVLLFFLLGENPTPKRAVLLAVIAFMATFSKQTGLAYAVAVFVWLLFKDRRAAAIYLVVSFVLNVGSAYWLNEATHGQFFRSIFAVAGSAPWLGNRIWDEVLFPHFLGRFGLMLALALVPFLVRPFKEWFKLALRPEYWMAGAGMAVAFISQPKLGSGAQQAMVSYAGWIICGMIGLHELSKWMNPKQLAPIASWFVGLAVAAQLVSLPMQYRNWIFDDYDREIHRQIDQVFRSGKTCFFNYPYYPTLFGQADCGQFGDQLMMWKNHKLDYSGKPDSMNEPINREEYDYVILPMTTDVRNDPTGKAIMEHYTPIYQIPAHPHPEGAPPLRYGAVVCKAKRLMSQGGPAQPQLRP